jgi:hypothetical protein
MSNPFVRARVSALLKERLELLEALKVADDHLKRIGVPTHNDTRMLLRAAIARAEGKAVIR